MENTRGSEWRRWDLHVHTKNTNKNDQFQSEDFESFCKVLFEKAIENQVCVIGVTDYFSIDNYCAAVKYQKEIDKNAEFNEDNKQKIKEILLLPNVELRMLPVTDRGRLVNIHCIFNPKYIEKLNNDFFNSLKHQSSGRDYSMTREGIVLLGKQSKPKANDEEAYKIGIEQFVVVHTDLKTLFDKNKELKNNTIIVVSNSNKDGNSAYQQHYDLFEGNTNALDDIRKTIYKLSDCVFSGNEKDRFYFLGKGADDIGTVKEKCGSIKPCIHGSDAHAEDKLFQPDNNRYCWIKADPTFEGLKQILYEPEDRVRIQESKPEEKSIYYVIDSVNFDIDKKWKGTIQLNPNLNTIIGGRATGKSTLLKAIAKKVSNSSFSYKDDTEKDFLKEYIENISISWLDGQDSENRDIEMLPQGNMYDIARDTRKLDDLIQRIIKDTEYNKHIENYESKNAQGKESITSDILNLFSLQKQIKDMELSLREKGDKKGIKAEIDNLAKRIEELNKGIGVSDEELKQFQENKNKITDIEQYVKQFGNDLSILKELKEQSILVPNYSEKFIDLSADVKNSLNVIFQELKTKIDEEWKNKISNEEATLSGKIQEQRKSLDSIQNSELFKKCKQNEGNNKELNDAETKLKEENGKLKDFEEIEKQLEERNKLKKEKIDSIVSSHISYKTNIQELVKELKIKHDDVEIKTTFCFTNTKFRSFLEDRLNQRGFERQNYIKSLVDNYPNETETACREFLCKALNGEIEYKNYNSNQSVVTEFFATNWFDYSFDLTYQNDTFSQMSDGKKAFVVLKLLLEFSNKKCPILIDQPEDSLDNRAIYNELVAYIRKKKTERQIILVTHNPNIVVGADAENVIVANQHGTDSLNENGMKFQYVNGSLEYTKKRPKDFDSKKDLVLTSQGIREHVCEILEGGEKAFQERENKYGFTK